MNKITADFPITLAANLKSDNQWRRRDISKFLRVIPEINETLEAGIVTIQGNKDIRGAVNDFVKGAFDIVILDKHYYAGKWEALPEELRNVVYETPNEARLINSFIKKLNKVKDQEHIVIVECRALIAELKPLVELVDHLKTIEVKATVKKAKEKAKKEEERRIQNDTDVVYQAVLPMKVMAQDKAEEHFRTAVQHAAEAILAKNGDLNKLVPIPDDLKNDSHEYQALAMARAFYLSICDGGISNSRVTISNEKVEYEVMKTRRDAGFEFDAYVAKLNTKINDTSLTAELHGNPWQGSTLIVNTKNKGQQVWRTKMIVNVSKYGKLFNQFPTTRQS